MGISLRSQFALLMDGRVTTELEYKAAPTACTKVLDECVPLNCALKSRQCSHHYYSASKMRPQNAKNSLEPNKKLMRVRVCYLVLEFSLRHLFDFSGFSSSSVQQLACRRTHQAEDVCHT